MTGFSFTMSNGSSIHFDSFDPEHTLIGYADPDDMSALASLLEDIDDSLEKMGHHQDSDLAAPTAP